MLMDSPQAIKRRRREKLHNANVIPDIRELTPPQVQKVKRKISAKRAELPNANEEARHLRQRYTEEEQDTDTESDEDIRAIGHDQQIEDLIHKRKHAHATAPSIYNMWHGIELERPSNDQNAGPPQEVEDQWAQMPYSDIDCDDTWALLTALSLKMRSNNYDPMDLKNGQQVHS